VQRLSGALRIELGPFGVQVMLVSPGFIDTKARETAKVRQDWVGLCFSAIAPRMSLYLNRA
jgi:NAD(P)-dependent dehydrogenase (short-subunit alcohol dehydrogenase family)